MAELKCCVPVVKVIVQLCHTHPAQSQESHIILGAFSPICIAGTKVLRSGSDLLRFSARQDTDTQLSLVST